MLCITYTTIAVITVSLDCCIDLDQLNLILGVLGSPSQEDLDCIVNEKVFCHPFDAFAVCIMLLN